MAMNSDHDGVPEQVLGAMMAGVAFQAAHLTPEPTENHGPSSVFLPGESFGRVLAWLWRSGRHDEVLELVDSYMEGLERRELQVTLLEGPVMLWNRLWDGMPKTVGAEVLDSVGVGAMCTYINDKLARLDDGFDDD